MTVAPGCRLGALKWLPRANPGLIVNESSGFADREESKPGWGGFNPGFVGGLGITGVSQTRLPYYLMTILDEAVPLRTMYIPGARVSPFTLTPSRLKYSVGNSSAEE